MANRDLACGGFFGHYKDSGFHLSRFDAVYILTRCLCMGLENKMRSRKGGVSGIY